MRSSKKSLSSDQGLLPVPRLLPGMRLDRELLLPSAASRFEEWNFLAEDDDVARISSSSSSQHAGVIEDPQAASDDLAAYLIDGPRGVVEEGGTQHNHRYDGAGWLVWGQRALVCQVCAII